ncbi:MAG TPA: lytic transglycosylase domain-containing protein [Gallionella sp.]|nr:lytic transglycosylase domain-containing protein [Gallionella sp.]
MKSLECISVLLLLTFCLVRPAWANIYFYNNDDGTVNLSNVPVDRRYHPMQPVAHDAAPPENAGKPPLKLANKAQYNRIVAEVARTYGLDSALLHAVISVESRYSASAVSMSGAVGLMQLMPATAKRYGAADLLDPVQNLNAGAKYLSYLLKLFNNDISLTLAAYNAGEGTVAKYGNRIPPFRETTNYVLKVMGFYREYQAGTL